MVHLSFTASLFCSSYSDLLETFADREDGFVFRRITFVGDVGTLGDASRGFTAGGFCEAR